MEKLILTGSEGKIGRIIKEPLSNLYEVHQIDQVKRAADRYYRADVGDIIALGKIFEAAEDPKYVIHLAGDSRVEAPWEAVLKNNIEGTRNVYECARLFGVSKLVFASSNHVTGIYEGIPPTLHKQSNPMIITVNGPARPDSDYGNSKYFGEGLDREYYDLYGIESICLRIGTVTQENNPLLDTTGRMMRTWLSHRDLIQLIQKSLAAPIGFGSYYGVSNNDGKFWDISNAETELGYSPIDNAANTYSSK